MSLNILMIMLAISIFIILSISVPKMAYNSKNIWHLYFLSMLSPQPAHFKMMVGFYDHFYPQSRPQQKMLVFLLH